MKTLGKIVPASGPLDSAIGRKPCGGLPWPLRNFAVRAGFDFTRV